ncbi:PREDICTED: uncharacterized protein LOC104602522 isoform X3 [Nelumbo nucifera]|uniref:Uncharacterized protein LOC104602522 isoform X3 n=1 Tax=Nelumbo nucifera TaxID=4432 RepID=A0A1U8APJ4_NELNU|nr:PREDICTED: uncharacterized protein LOC104602522 isoform X3 [Nelumbo nucifera]
MEEANQTSMKAPSTLKFTFLGISSGFTPFNNIAADLRSPQKAPDSLASHNTAIAFATPTFQRWKGYHVCTTIGKASSVNVNLIDREDPQKGVNVRMSSSGSKGNCSLTVSVFCDSNGVEGPYSLEKSGTCDYATILKHPAGCAKIISVHRRGWGWLGTIITIILCLLGGYLLVGAVYRFFFLGIRGIEVIPNLEFWLSLPQRTKSLLGSLVRKFRGPSRGYRSSYSPVNF